MLTGSRTARRRNRPRVPVRRLRSCWSWSSVGSGPALVATSPSGLRARRPKTDHHETAARDDVAGGEEREEYDE